MLIIQLDKVFLVDITSIIVGDIDEYFVFLDSIFSDVAESDFSVGQTVSSVKGLEAFSHNSLCIVEGHLGTIVSVDNCGAKHSSYTSRDVVVLVLVSVKIDAAEVRMLVFDSCDDSLDIEGVHLISHLVALGREVRAEVSRVCLLVTTVSLLLVPLLGQVSR